MGTRNTDAPQFRIGQSYDVHPLVEGRPLILAGIKIPHNRGLMGHSDADVVYHVVTDALFGALAKGDIGMHFPDNDPALKNADSSVFLRDAAALAHQSGYSIANVDVTIIAQEPRLAPFIESMRAQCANALGISIDRVSIKARTHENIGSLGRGEGIAALGILLLERLY